MGTMTKKPEHQISTERRRFLKGSLAILGGVTGAGLLGLGVRPAVSLDWRAEHLHPNANVQLSVGADPSYDGKPVTVIVYRLAGGRRQRIARLRGRLQRGGFETQCELTYPHREIVPGNYQYVARVKIGRFLPRWIQSEPISYEVRPFYFGS